MEDNLSLSILTPIFHGEDFINDCVDTAYKQTFVKDSIKNSIPFEMIIGVDGCEKSLKKVDKLYHSGKYPNLKYIINDKNYGIAKTMNSLLYIASNDIYIMYDADDMMCDPNHIKNSINNFIEDKIVGVRCRYNTFIEENHEIKYTGAIGHACGHIFYRRDKIINNLGGYNNYYSCSDTDILHRAEQIGRVVLCNSMMDRRLHSFNMDGEGMGGGRNCQSQEIIERREREKNMIKLPGSYLPEELKIDPEFSNIIGKYL